MWGWTSMTRQLGIVIIPPQGQVAPIAIDFLWASEEAFDTPLNLGQDRPHWYVVYRGLCLGIYRTQYIFLQTFTWICELTVNDSLEVSLNVIGVYGMTHKSFESLEVVREKYQRALDEGRIQVSRHWVHLVSVLCIVATPSLMYSTLQTLFYLVPPTLAQISDKERLSLEEVASTWWCIGLYV